MTRAPIIAGKAVIVVQLQDTINQQLMSMKQKLKKFSSSIGSLGLDMFGAGLVGTLPIGKFLKDFQDFEDKILFLSTKLDASASDFANLTEKIRQLGRSTSFTASQVADAATVLAQAGFTAREVSNSLQATLDFARGAQITLSQSGEILANTMRTFGYETTRASEVASQFIVAARLGTLDVIDLKESIKELSGTARSLNIDLPTTLALLTQMASRSLRGTKAGTSLNTALLNLAGKADTIKETLGVDVQDSAGNLLNVVDVLDKLYVSISKLGNVKRTHILQTLFNIRGGRAVTALDEIKQIVDLTKQIRTAGNESRIAAVKMDSGFGGAVRRATSALQDMSLTLGGIAAGPLTTFLDLVPPLTASLQQLVEQNQMVTLGLLAVPPALLATGVGMLALSAVTTKLAGMTGILLSAFRSLGSRGFGLVGTQIAGLIIGFNRLKKAGRDADKGLSAVFLRPQRVKRGPTAGKIKPSSFFGRMGATNLLAPLQRQTNQLANTLARLIPTVNGISMAVDRAIVSLGRFGSLLNATTGITRRLVSIMSSLSAIMLVSLAPSMDILIKRASITVTALSNIIRQVKFLGISAKASFAAMFAGAKALTVYGVAMAITAKLGDAIRALTLDFSKLGKNKSLIFLASFFKVLQSSLKFLAAGNIAAALNPKRFALLKTMFSGTGLAKGLSGLLGAGSTGFKGLLAVFKTLPSAIGRIVSGLYSMFKFAGGLTLTLGKAAFTVTRFVFSFNGVFLIAQLLLLFGHRVEFIRKAFARLGEGISNAFGRIGDIFRSSFGGAVGGLFGAGFQSLLRGDGAIGIQQIGKALGYVGQIISTNLTLAWTDLVHAIAPAYDFMRKLISSTMELASLMGTLFGQSFGTGLQGIGNAISSGIGSSGGLSGLIKDIWAQIDMKGIFKGIGTFMKGVAETALGAIQWMAESVVNTMITIQSMLKGLLVQLDKSGLLLEHTKPEQEMLGGSIFRMNFQLKRMSATFENMPNKMQEALQTFSDSLDKIFNKPAAEETNKAKAEATIWAQLGAFAQADADKQLADRIANSQDGYLRDFGAFLGGGGFKLPNIVDWLSPKVDPNAPNLDNIIKGALSPENLMAGFNAVRTFVQSMMATGATRFIQQRGNIRDITAALVGDIQSTRRNTIQAAGITNEQQQTEYLKGINAAVGGSGQTPYLKDILEKIAPDTLQ